MKGDFSRFAFDPTKNYHGVLQQQGRVQLDSDVNESAAIDAYLDRAALIDIVGPCFLSRETPRAFAITPAKGSFTIGVGRMWVDGLLAECFGTGALSVDPVLDVARGSDPVPYEGQPFLPEPPPLPEPPFLVYLDVWQRSVTAAEDPSLADAALGGADTTTRIQTVWQVRATPGDELPPLDPRGMLTIVPPSAGFRGLENQLYRVEIHEPGALGQAGFKWSRDNGATAAPVANVSEASIELGRALFEVTAGDLVEVLDERDELSERPGVLARVKEAAGERLVLREPLEPGWFDPAMQPRLRRWEGHQTAGQVELEPGIEVSFGESSYRTGDWWVFAARTVDGSVERLDGAPPRGIHHHHCVLALVTAPDQIEDRRPAAPTEPPRSL